jgi:hypothetical protein
MELYIGKPLLRIRLMPKPIEPIEHAVLKVHLSDTDETWVIDTTGCQYGFREILVPCEKYLIDRNCIVSIRPTAYLTHETFDLDFYEALRHMVITQRQQEEKDLQRQARKHFGLFVEKHLHRDILNYTERVFRPAYVNIITLLKVHMMRFAKDEQLISIATPESEEGGVYPSNIYYNYMSTQESAGSERR